MPAALFTGRLMRRLALPAVGFALLAATFGTSTVFWAVFAPGKNHPADAALFALVVYLTFLYFNAEQGSRWMRIGLGAALGFSITVRYFAGAEAVALVLVLACLRRWRHEVEVAAATACMCALLFAIPLVLNTPVFGGGYDPSTQAGFYPLNPLRMLFTDYRGLFIWSPTAVLAVVGLVVLYRARPEFRRFLTAAYAMGLSIVLSYAFVPYWTGPGRSGSGTTRRSFLSWRLASPAFSLWRAVPVGLQLWSPPCWRRHGRSSSASTSSCLETRSTRARP